MTFVPFTAEEVDAKSPLDDALFGKMKDDFDDLDNRVITAGNSPFIWEILGPLRQLQSYKRSFAYGLVNKEFTPTVCRFMMKKSGIGGTFSFDIRKHIRTNIPITGIDHQFSDSTTSIARASGANTQSIARATPQISTQSISFAKAAANVQSIIQVIGTNLWRYNLDVALDSDTLVGDSITFASCTAGGNNGTFTIVEANQNGYPSVVVSNASGVAQTGAAGTAQPKIMSYNFTNPVSSEFAAGESAIFASHTSGANDGTLTIYKVNQSGNNIWVKNASGVVQAGVAGNTNVARWIYTYSVAVSTALFVVGQKAHFATHTSGNNDGDFPITAVNSGGNNIVVYNTAGVAQASAAGTGTPNHWVHTVGSNPTAQINVGDTIYTTGHTNPLNDGTWTASVVTSTTIAYYNLAGVAQGGSAGTIRTTKKLVKFAADQSANFTTDSYIEMVGAASGLYNIAQGRAPFRVLEINRGGGANYNVVIDNPTAPSQASPAGMVAVEMKSIFNTAPSIAASYVGLIGNENLVGVSSDLIGDPISAQTPLMLYFTSAMDGDPQDLTVLLS